MHGYIEFVYAIETKDPISEQVVIQSLELILDRRNYPLIVMCNLGRHRTGISSYTVL